MEQALGRGGGCVGLAAAVHRALTGVRAASRLVPPPPTPAAAIAAAAARLRSGAHCSAGLEMAVQLLSVAVHSRRRVAVAAALPPAFRGAAPSGHDFDAVSRALDTLVLPGRDGDGCGLSTEQLQLVAWLARQAPSRLRLVRVLHSLCLRVPGW